MWIAPQPVYGEVALLRANGLVHQELGYISDIQPYLWMQTIEVISNSLIESLELPVNPNLHIFSITFKLRD